MYKRLAKGKKNIVILSSILLLSLVLMTINIKSPKGAFFLESVIAWTVSPIQKLFTRTVDAISDIFSHYVFLVNVTKENDALHREIDSLRARNNELIERMYWQGRVGDLLNYRENYPKKTLVASIIGRDATQWSKMVFIDKGTRQGARENQAVVTDAGVVGHVMQAMGNSAKVLLIVDSRSAVDALFQESRVSGVVAGTGQNWCDMKYVPYSAKVEVGDVVLSSGLGGVFPKGLVVGRVTHVKKKKQGLFQEIAVAPGADLARLEEVLVLLDD